jgi:hypothetical protein
VEQKQAKPGARRRGLPGQRARRIGEREARVSALAFARWCKREGLVAGEAAQRLGLTARTLERWSLGWGEARLRLRARGRPPHVCAPETRRSILEALHRLGPLTGLPTLQRAFPGVARGELVELKRRWCRAHRRRNRWTVLALRWARIGAVWSADYTKTPWLAGEEDHVFAVRDLGSGLGLAAEAVPGERAAPALRVLEGLCAVYGAPLVLKCDNGSALRSAVLKAWAERQGVLLLYSYPYWPEYNGSIESSLGWLKSHACYAAARHDRPDRWTAEDLELGRCRANVTVKPEHGNATPAELWNAREDLTADERGCLLARYRRHHARECWTRRLPRSMKLEHATRAAIDREAIVRALEEEGFLTYRRRRIPLPFSKRKRDKIT